MQYGYGGVNGKGAVVEIQNMFACQWGIGGINGKGGVALIKHAIMVFPHVFSLDVHSTQ